MFVAVTTRRLIKYTERDAVPGEHCRIFGETTMSELMLDVGQANELKMAFRRAGFVASEVKTLVEGTTLAQFREVLLGRACIVPIEMEVKPIVHTARNTLTVLPGLTLSERINAGQYDWMSHDIMPDIMSGRFPHDPTTIGEWEWEFMGADKNVSSENAKAAIEVDGWIAASWEHLFAFGAAFPEAQRKNLIVALGFVCRVSGYRCVLELWSDSGLRNVDLRRWDGAWAPYCRFLRVRKVGTSVA